MSGFSFVDDAVSVIEDIDLEKPFTSLVKLVGKVLLKAAAFGPTLSSLKETLEKLEQTIKRIKENDSKSGRRDKMKGLKDLLRRAHARVEECENVNFFMRSQHTDKLNNLIVEIKDFIDFDLELYTAEAVSETLVHAKRLDFMCAMVTEIRENTNKTLEMIARERSLLSGGSGVLSGSASSLSFYHYRSAPPMELKPEGSLATAIYHDQQLKEGAPHPAMTSLISNAIVAVSAVPGERLDQVFTGLLQVIDCGIQKKFVCADTMKELKDTLNKMEPNIREMAKYVSESDRANNIKGLIDLMEHGIELVKKCENVSAKSSKYTVRLEELQARLAKYIGFDLPIQIAAVGREKPALIFEHQLISIATGAVAAVPGNKLDQVFTGLLQAIYFVIQKNVAFKDTMTELTDTLHKMEPKIREIAKYDSESDRPNDIQGLIDLMNEGIGLVKKCETVSAINVIKRTKYTVRLEDLQARLAKYVGFDLQIQIAAVGRETLSDARQGAAAASKALEVAERHERVGAEILQNTRRQEKVGNLIADQVIHTGLAAEEINSGVKGIQAAGQATKQIDSGVKEIDSVMKDLSNKVNALISLSTGTQRVLLEDCSPPPLNMEPVGLEIPLRDLKKQVLDEQVPVLVVSALAGFGKTTLVTAFCHDPQVKDRFGDRIFYFTVSKDPDLLNIVHRLLQKNGSKPPRKASEEDLLNRLGDVLEEMGTDPKLLVLDDVWSESKDLIEKFMFPIDNYQILVTSRSEFPALGFTYKLKELSPEDAMILLCQSALPQNGKSSVPDQDVVNEIVKSCKGHPLAISVIGRSLRGKKEADWNQIAEKYSDSGSLVSNFEQLQASLQSSVDALKGDVQNCFADLGLFNEDQRIPAATLVDIWVEKYNLKDVNAIVNLFKLSSRNLVDVVLGREETSEEDGFYNEHFVTQQDMLRELAVIKNGSGPVEERTRLFLNLRGNKTPDWWKKRNQLLIAASILSISTDKTFKSDWSNLQAPKVEVLILNFQSQYYVLPEFIETMQKLKVLIAINNGLIPAELGNSSVIVSLSNLKRIRLEKIWIRSSLFNSLRLNKLEKMSFVMCNIVEAFADPNIDFSETFPNLKEVNIHYCNDLVELPPGFCNLCQLTKLSITDCHKLIALPEDIGKLTSLKVLRLNSCIELLELPSSIEGLQELKVLDISSCYSIKALPEEIGELSSLTKLCMVDCSSCELPTTVVKLVKLNKVIGDEETVNSWKRFKYFLKNLDMKVHKASA